MKKSLKTAFVTDKCDSNGTTLLMESARQGAYEQLLQCLDEGYDINAVDRAGNNALMYAIEGRQPEMAALLLNRGIDAEQKNASGSTPLLEAGGAKTPEIVQRLLQKKVAVDVQNEHGNTALIMACAAGDGWAACKLVEAGADADNLRNAQGANALMLARRVMIPKDVALFEACVERRREKLRQEAVAAAEQAQREKEQVIREATVLQRDVVPLKPVAFRRKGF